ncbi:Glutaminyl-peptide cyclotransferase [Sarcoptes scabiei]|nr:Glutaminyl-peptide cyclotransferase [Sarcoptes scabiei]
MKLALTHPVHGFYMKQDVFGSKGHFITAPEISQIFGELIAVWIVYMWQNYSGQKPLSIIELGPGRGTLSLDMARSISQLGTQVKNGCEFHLVEISSYLRSIQYKNLCGKELGVDFSSKSTEKLESKTIYNQSISWHSSVDEILTISNSDRFLVFIANEFFDAFPIHKLIKISSQEWRELLIDFDSEKNQLKWIKSRDDTPISKLIAAQKNFKQFKTDDHLEFSPQTLTTIESIIDQINQNQSGCLLICDYGYYDDCVDRDTFRAFRNHVQCDPLKDPGFADLTADVDFKMIKEHLDRKAKCFGPINQRDFLLAMGLQLRLQMLLQSLDRMDRQKQKDLISSAKMLLEDMGNRFKFMSIFGLNQNESFKPIGFD